MYVLPHPPPSFVTNSVCSMAISSFLTAPDVDFLYINNLLVDYQHPLTSSGPILVIRKCIII